MGDWILVNQWVGLNALQRLKTGLSLKKKNLSWRMTVWLVWAVDCMMLMPPRNKIGLCVMLAMVGGISSVVALKLYLRGRGLALIVVEEESA